MSRSVTQRIAGQRAEVPAEVSPGVLGGRAQGVQDHVHRRALLAGDRVRRRPGHLIAVLRAWTQRPELSALRSRIVGMRAPAARVLTSLAGLGNAFAIDCSFGRDEKYRREFPAAWDQFGDQIEGN